MSISFSPLQINRVSRDQWPVKPSFCTLPLNRGASWERMLIKQPPFTSLIIHYKETQHAEVRGRAITMGVFETTMRAALAAYTNDVRAAIAGIMFEPIRSSDRYITRIWRERRECWRHRNPNLRELVRWSIVLSED